jgi:hypothetical protein
MEALLTLALLGSLAFMRLRQPIGDPDLWWHLAAGGHILDGHGLPRADTFSYVAGGRPWTVYSWLAETLFTACYRALGPRALIALAAALVATTFGVVLRTCRAAGARLTVAVSATFLAALMSAPTWTVRPHLFSFLFMAVVGRILVADRRQDQEPNHFRPYLWILVPTMVIWANVHVFFVYGLATIGLHVLTHWRSWIWDTGKRRIPWRRVALLIGVGTATLVNPYGAQLLAHLAELARGEVAFSIVSELQTPSLHHLHGQLLTVFFFATVLALILSPARKDPAEVVAVFLFAFLAYSMARNMPFLAIVGAPVLARHFDAFLPAHHTGHGALSSTRRVLNAALLGLSGILFILGVRTGAFASPDSAASPS